MDILERPKSLTSIVIERLRDSIVDGTIQPGTLLSEKQMADMFGTSKTPVREAFAHLQSLGLVGSFQPEPGAGARTLRDSARTGNDRLQALNGKKSRRLYPAPCEYRAEDD
jgi:DNA-binding GntR family transcriptional regulator